MGRGLRTILDSQPHEEPNQQPVDEHTAGQQATTLEGDSFTSRPLRERIKVNNKQQQQPDWDRAALLASYSEEPRSHHRLRRRRGEQPGLWHNEDYGDIGVWEGTALDGGVPGLGVLPGALPEGRPAHGGPGRCSRGKPARGRGGGPGRAVGGAQKLDAWMGTSGDAHARYLRGCYLMSEPFGYLLLRWNSAWIISPSSLVDLRLSL